MSDEVRSASLPVSLRTIPLRVPLIVSPKGVVYDCIIWRMVDFTRMLSGLLVARSKSTFILRPEDNLETWELARHNGNSYRANELAYRSHPYSNLRYDAT